MKDRLKQRKEKHQRESSARRAEESVPPGLSTKERQEYIEAKIAEDEADSLLEEDAILSALQEVHQNEKRQLLGEIIRSNNEMSDEEKQDVIDKMVAESKEVEGKFKGMEEYSQAMLAAKLAARKRLRDEKKKEEALKRELNALSEKQVYFIVVF